MSSYCKLTVSNCCSVWHFYNVLNGLRGSVSRTTAHAHTRVIERAVNDKRLKVVSRYGINILEKLLFKLIFNNNNLK